MRNSNNRLGIGLMVATMVIFAFQDGLSRHLAENYNVLMVVMIRYWFFATFAVWWSMKNANGWRAAVATDQPILQIFRAVLLALEICVMVLAFTYIGLVESMAVFAAYPLVVAALSGPVLGENVGWRRWIAIMIGFVGVLIILNPTVNVFTPAALIPLASASMFALYSLLTRFAARKDPASVSFLWVGLVGAVVMTLVGIWSWEPMTRFDSVLMAMLCVSGALAHWLLIKVYEIAEASSVQPFAFLHIVFAAGVGIIFFSEELHFNVAVGSGIVLAAGLFTVLRETQSKEPG